MTPEFSRVVRLDTLGNAGRTLTISAEAEERSALARRFAIVAIERLCAEVSLSRSGERVVASGTLRAEVTQSCVATGEPVAQSLDEAFRIEFRPQPTGISKDDEIELGEDELDVVFYDGAAVDIGEAVAETLSLGLDPYPRSANAEDALRKAGVKDEQEAGPFGALAALRDKLE